MNKNIELEIERESIKIENQLKNLNDLNQKLERIQNQIANLEAGFQKSQKRIAELGMKTPRRDGKPETPEDEIKRTSHNEELLQMKIQLLKSALDKKDPNFWKAFEKYCPDILKGIGLK